MASWFYWPVQAAVDWLYAPPSQNVQGPPVRPWCEGMHIITSRELEVDEHEFTAILPLFPQLDAIKQTEIPDDGNCLFRALATFLEKNPDDVRSAIAAYLQEHISDEFVHESIPLCIEEHNERCQKQLDSQTASIGTMFEEGYIDVVAFSAQLRQLGQEIEAKKIATADEYVRRISSDRFFGGTIEVYAAAHLYNISIGVYEARGGKYSPSFICAPPEAEGRGKCSLLYTCQRRHYDLIIA